MEFVSIKQKFLYIGILGIILLLWFHKKRGVAFLIAVAVFVGLNDFISHAVLKEYIARLRPCHVLPDITRVMSCSNSFSFPSNHASNIFTAATLMSLCFRKLTWIAVPMALLVCYSRVYLGVHYPSDVLAGAVWGGMMGYLGFKAQQVIHKTLNQLPPFKNASPEE